MLATCGHSWSQVVTPGHRWSHLVTGGHIGHYHPRHARTLFKPSPRLQKTLYTKEFEFPALFAPHALAVSRHPRHAKTLFSPSPPRQNTFCASPDTPKHYSHHSQNALYTEKFEFPALFSAVHWPIGPVPEINVPGHDPDHHRKFRRNRTRQLGLVRLVTDRRQTDGQTDRLRRC